ncbi:MAG TPA: hypothetical protein VFN30_01845 [Chitinophagaceae bacterium]|nr:hypothetical protein [Chitinophagaceae bacterium]
MAHAHLFQHNNFTGRQMIADNPDGVRYALTPFATMSALSFNDITSSLRLHSSTPAIPSMCILFEHAGFNGNVKAFAFNANRDISSLPGFNDVTSSVLIVEHDPNPNKTILKLRQLAGNRINSAIDDNLSGISEVSRSGDVKLKFVIDLDGLVGIDLVLVEIPVKVHTPWPFSDYSAKIRYWINLFIDGSNRLQGFVNAWGYWIEGGILTGSIEGKLKPQVEANIGAVESNLNSMLREVNFHRWTDVYLLPGSSNLVTDDYDSNVNDEVSVILPYMEG